MRYVIKLSGGLLASAAAGMLGMWAMDRRATPTLTAGRDVDTSWSGCAKKIGLAPETIAKCADGSEGKDLVAASFERAKQRGATGSPTIYIGGTEYEGGRRFADLMRGVCRAFTGEAPAA